MARNANAERDTAILRGDSLLGSVEMLSQKTTPDCAPDHREISSQECGYQDGTGLACGASPSCHCEKCHDARCTAHANAGAGCFGYFRCEGCAGLPSGDEVTTGTESEVEKEEGSEGEGEEEEVMEEEEEERGVNEEVVVADQHGQLGEAVGRDSHEEDEKASASQRLLVPRGDRRRDPSISPPRQTKAQRISSHHLTEEQHTGQESDSFDSWSAYDPHDFYWSDIAARQLYESKQGSLPQPEFSRDRGAAAEGATAAAAAHAGGGGTVIVERFPYFIEVSQEQVLQEQDGDGGPQEQHTIHRTLCTGVGCGLCADQTRHREAYTHHTQWTQREIEMNLGTSGLRSILHRRWPDFAALCSSNDFAPLTEAFFSAAGCNEWESTTAPLSDRVNPEIAARLAESLMVSTGGIPATTSQLLSGTRSLYGAISKLNTGSDAYILWLRSVNSRERAVVPECAWVADCAVRHGAVDNTRCTVSLGDKAGQTWHGDAAAAAAAEPIAMRAIYKFSNFPTNSGTFLVYDTAGKDFREGSVATRTTFSEVGCLMVKTEQGQAVAMSCELRCDAAFPHANAGHGHSQPPVGEWVDDTYTAATGPNMQGQPGTLMIRVSLIINFRPGSDIKGFHAECQAHFAACDTTISDARMAQFVQLQLNSDGLAVGDNSGVGGATAKRWARLRGSRDCPGGQGRTAQAYADRAEHLRPCCNAQPQGLRDVISQSRIRPTHPKAYCPPCGGPISPTDFARLQPNIQSAYMDLHAKVLGESGVDIFTMPHQQDILARFFHCYLEFTEQGTPTPQERIITAYNNFVLTQSDVTPQYAIMGKMQLPDKLTELLAKFKPELLAKFKIVGNSDRYLAKLGKADTHGPTHVSPLKRNAVCWRNLRLNRDGNALADIPKADSQSVHFSPHA